eukprot:252946_1
MSAIVVLDLIILYATYGVLFIYLYIFICNFASHFKFNRCECPWIVRDENVSAIYPTLLTFHIFIGLILSSLITYATWNNSHYSIQSISCYMQFKLFSTDLLQPVWITNIMHLIATCAMYVLLLLETYFSYGRYYGCIYYVMEHSDTPSKYCVLLPFVVYTILLFALLFFSITMIPIIALLVSMLHILINTYYNYYFYMGIKLSYRHILQMQESKTTRDQMRQQIRQIRSIFHLSLVSTFISAFTICTCISCNSILRIVPICLCCSSFCLFLVFNNNKTLLKATICCQCKTVNELLCIAPFKIVKRRRSTFASRNKPPIVKTVKKVELTHVESRSVHDATKKDERDKKVRELKKKASQKVAFGADVLMDIIASEDEIVIPPQIPIQMGRSSSLNSGIDIFYKADDKTDSPVPRIRKSSSEHGPSTPTLTNKKGHSRNVSSFGSFSSLSSFQTIRDWMAPISFAKIRGDKNAAKSINAFLNGYGFTAHSPDALKMDDLPDLETRIPNIDVIMELDEEDTDEKVTDEEVTI